MGGGHGASGGRALNLFIFGCGYSASYFARTRASSFASICGTTRGADAAARLAASGITGLVFDGARFDAALLRRLEQADALLVSTPPDGAADPALRAFRAAIAAAPRLVRIVYLSTIGVYGDHQGAWVDETSATHPGSARNQARLGVERQWLALGAETGKAVHVLRLAGIYGPGQNVLQKLRDGTAQRIVNPGQVFNRIHVADIARAIAAAFAHGGEGGICNVADDEPTPPQDVMLFGAGLLGIAPPPQLDFSSADLSPMARSFYGENKRVRNTRLKQQLGVSLAYPTYREGLRALAAL